MDALPPITGPIAIWIAGAAVPLLRDEGSTLSPAARAAVVDSPLRQQGFGPSLRLAASSAVLREIADFLDAAARDPARPATEQDRADARSISANAERIRLALTGIPKD